VRSRAQARRKFQVARDAGLRSPGTSVPQHTERAARALDTSGDEAYWVSLVADDDAVRRGLASGELTTDTRARDRLRAFVAGTPVPDPAIPTLADDIAFAIEAQAMLDHDSWVKLPGRAERLERAIGALERSVLSRGG
jgi:hypothetical protein